MNINLNDIGGDDEGLQPEIDEHIEIMRGTGQDLTGQVMLLSDPEYPGVYRVWTQADRDPYDHMYTWVWVTPDGEVIATKRPWVVTA